MSIDVFDIENFNVFEDEENFYFFRAFNMADNKDIDDGIVFENGKFKRIRTDRERWEEDSDKKDPKYNKESNISLSEVYDHIKMHYRKDTNCISLSSNTNVSIVYGRGYYQDRYGFIKVAKSELNNSVYNAGQYMIREIEKEINNAISKLDSNNDQKLINALIKIDETTSNQEITNLMADLYTNKKHINKRYLGKTVDFVNKKSIVNRVSSYKSLNEEQTLEKNKIIAKLMVLEHEKRIKPLIKNTLTNSNLIRTIGTAFSSSELIHYGDIKGENVKKISKEMMDILSLIQQQDNNDEKVKEIKQVLIKKINDGYDIKKIDNKYVFTNGNESTDLFSFDANVLEKDYQVNDDTSIEKMYKLTGGRVNYAQGKSFVEKLFYLEKSRSIAREYANALNTILDDNEEYKDVIENIKENGFEIEPEIVTKKSRDGYVLSEAVSLDLKDKELELLDYIKNNNIENEEELDVEEMISRFFSDEKNKEEVSKEEYYSNAIIDAYDWENIGVEFTQEERKLITEKIKENNPVEIYNELKQKGIEEDDVSKIVINYIINEKNSKSSFDSIEEIEKLKQNISIQQIERFLGYNNIPGTDIVLRDYQQRATSKIDEIYQNDKKFASVVLPTGAGKSYVVLDQLIKHRDEKMIYFAPSNIIISQTKDLIVKMHGKENTLGKTVDEIVKEEFPNLEFSTYTKLLFKSKEELKNEKYNYVVLDELHRTGADKWGKKLDELLVAQDDVKVLGVTATPKRDRDRKNTAKVIAKKLGYTDEEIKNEDYMAMKLDLVDAIKMGIIVNPKLVACAYNLINEGRLENLLEKINSIDDEAEKKYYKEKYEILRRSISEAKGVPEIFRDNIVKKNGRYILFIPVQENEYLGIDEEGNEIEKIKSEDKVREAGEQIKEWLKYVDSNPEIYSIIGAQGEKKNEQELSEFKNSNSDHIKIMIAINMLNEGMHIPGINGIIWHRAIDEDSKILIKQQLGRCIYALDEDDEINDENRPIVIDLANNMLKLDLQKEINSYTKRDDLELLIDVVEWIEKHNGYMPNIDSASREERRKAKTLKRIQDKYAKYLDLIDDLSDEKDAKLIKNIIAVGGEIDLWDQELPEQTIEENDKIIDDWNYNDFELKGILKDLYELEKELDTNSKRDKALIYSGEKAIELLGILKEEGVVLNKIPTIKYENSKPISTKLQDIKQEGIDIEYIIKKYNFNGELDIARIIKNLKVAYRGNASEEEKKKIEKLELYRVKNDSIMDIIRVLEILKSEGIELSKIKQTRFDNNKTHYIKLKELKQEGIDISEIINRNNLDGEFELGTNIYKLKRIYKGTTSATKERITDDEKERIEKLELINEENDLENVLNIAEVLKQNKVDLSKITLVIYEKDGQTKGKKLKELKQQGVDINKIIEENGLDGEYLIGAKIRTVRANYRKGNYNKEEQKRIENAGILKPKEKSVVSQTLDVLEILKNNGIDINRIAQGTARKGKKEFTSLKDINQENVDIDRIIEENNLDPNFLIGYKITIVKQAYNGKGSYGIKQDEIKRIDDLEFKCEKESTVEKFFYIVDILKENGVNIEELEFGNSNETYKRLKDLKQDNIDFDSIIAMYNLDGNYNIGRTMKRIKNLKEGSIPKGFNISKQEIEKAKEMNLIKENKTKVEEILEVLKVLKNNGVDVTKIPIYIGNNNITTLKDIKQDQVNIMKVIQENDLDSDYKIGQFIQGIRGACKGKRGYLITEENRKEIDELGIIPEEVKECKEKTFEILEILKDHGIELSKIKRTKYVNGKSEFITLEEINQNNVDIDEIIDKYQLDRDYKIGSQIYSIVRQYNGTAKGGVLSEEERKKAECLGIVKTNIDGQDIGKISYDASTKECDKAQKEMQLLIERNKYIR